MIKASVKFVGYRDFFNYCDYIKKEYKHMIHDDKQVYKYYIYSRRYLNEYTCDLIWNYLNDNYVDGELITKEILHGEIPKHRM